MQTTADVLNQPDGSANAAESLDNLKSAEAIDVAEMGALEWVLVGVSILILFAFVSSFIKWIGLLRQGKRPFGSTALVPVSPRPRPYWNAIHFVIFYGFVIVFSVLMSVGAGALGYLDLDALREARSESASVESSDLQVSELSNEGADAAEPTVVDTATPPSTEAAIEEPPVITVRQLLISSFAMLFATLATMGLLTLMRPLLTRTAIRTESSLSELPQHKRPGFGWQPSLRLVGLGLVAAWLILPPTMLMMGAVSALQEYSHPVLDALQPADGSDGPNFAIFAALFFTTAIVTPVVEEFWFRGLLQGGLQRLADARTDAINWGMIQPSVPAEAITRLPESGNPFQPPGLESAMENSAPRADGDSSLIPNPATRTDWTPTAIWPIVVASLLFAIMHWGQGLAPIPLFFLSLGLGYLYRQTGSLIPSIVVHFVLNGFTMSATFLEMLK